MKKLLIISLMTALICAISACSDEKTENSSMQSSSESIIETSEITQSETSENTEPATTEQATESEMTTESVSTIAEVTTEMIPETTTVTTSENYSQIDASEGIVFDTPVAEKSEPELIAAALALFQSACKTEWDYTVGSPYEIDMNQTAQNQFGWDCYLITTEGINSLADVRADYHKVFSENYADSLDEVFTEVNGHVYCLNGTRGADIFYEKSVFVSIDSRSESEIAFTVQNSYSGDDFGGNAYNTQDEFVISIDSDGAWRVAKFRMPY
ncbi:MAG: hypothetical protein K2I82_06245 [Ruminococcus sp.]|nr:hypothetical protein [Ruminococcus sp.]